jgi:hypothetical protein
MYSKYGRESADFGYHLIIQLVDGKEPSKGEVKEEKCFNFGCLNL